MSKVWRLSIDWSRYVNRADVGADLLEQLVELDDGRRPLGDPDLVSPPRIRVDQLAEDDLQLVGLVAQRLHRRPSCRDT